MSRMYKKLSVLFAISMIFLGGVPGFAPRAQAAQSANEIVLSKPGKVLVTVQHLGAGCTGRAGLNSPDSVELFSDYKQEGGQSRLISQTYPAGTSLEFFIHPGDWCDPGSGVRVLSSDTTRARVTSLASSDAWRIDFEDLPPDHPKYDGDFNDLILVVRVVSEAPDYKQNDPRWADLPYDQIPDATIEELGAGLAAAGDVLAYHGGLNDTETHDQLTLDVLDACLSNPQVAGYYQGYVRWSRVGWCSEAANPRPPFLLRWDGKLADGDGLGSGQAELRAAAAADLANGLPVIFEVADPEEPGGIHYLVGKSYDSSTDEFAVNDPWCAGDFSPECQDTPGTLSASNTLEAVIRFNPADAAGQKVLVLNAPAGAQVLITDPQGNRTGWDAGLPLAEIANSNAYTQDPLTVQPDGAPQQESMSELYILDPQPGKYTVEISGGAAGGSLRADYQAGPLNAMARSLGLQSDSEQHILYVLPNAIYWDQINLYLPLMAH